LEALRSSRKWETARLLPAVNAPLAALLGFLVFLTGLLPVAILVATGLVVGSIPDALHEGLSSSAGRHAMFAMAGLGLCFVMLQAAGAARAAAGASLGWQLNRQLEHRVMSAVTSPAGIGHLEDPGALDRIAAARDVVVAGYRPCDAVPAMASRASVWLQGAGAGAVLVTFHWWLALAVVGVWVWKAHVAKRWHAKGVTTIGVKSPALRRGEYLRDLALTPGAAKEIRVFGLTDWLVGRYREETAALQVKAERDRRSVRWAGAVSTWAAVAVTLTAYIVVALSATSGKLGLQGLALYVSAIAAIQVVVHVGVENMMLESGTVPVPAVRILEGALDGIAVGGVEPPAGSPRQELRFEAVRFRYPGASHDALADLDLTLPAGKSVAIVGVNGAGKTTLIKLLCRFYEPDAGRITVDGQPVASFDARAWQRRVAAVFQDFVRYPFTARDNIALGEPDGVGAEDAARRAGALATLEALPDGLDTVLGSQYVGGVELSGGEWQRVVLARALFAASSGAGVLVLDEPAANLDARGEAELYDRFLDITRGVTTVVISHRFSTVRRADLIYVLDRGRVAEHGSHDELMAGGGAYAGMFRIQAERLLGP
jgi:ATP-binding cassette subfamily B protein